MTYFALAPIAAAMRQYARARSRIYVHSGGVRRHKLLLRLPAHKARARGVICLQKLSACPQRRVVPGGTLSATSISSGCNALEIDQWARHDDRGPKQAANRLHGQTDTRITLLQCCTAPHSARWAYGALTKKRILASGRWITLKNGCGRDAKR